METTRTTARIESMNAVRTANALQGLTKYNGNNAMNYYELRALSESADTDSKLASWCRKYCDMEDFYLDHCFIKGSERGDRYFNTIRQYYKELMQYINQCKNPRP